MISLPKVKIMQDFHIWQRGHILLMLTVFSIMQITCVINVDSNNNNNNTGDYMRPIWGEPEAFTSTQGKKTTQNNINNNNNEYLWSAPSSTLGGSARRFTEEKKLKKMVAHEKDYRVQGVKVQTLQKMGGH